MGCEHPIKVGDEVAGLLFGLLSLLLGSGLVLALDGFEELTSALGVVVEDAGPARKEARRLVDCAGRGPEGRGLCQALRELRVEVKGTLRLRGGVRTLGMVGRG
jgi:hypothetical protein